MKRFLLAVFLLSCSGCDLSHEKYVREFREEAFKQDFEQEHPGWKVEWVEQKAGDK